jgi:apolipoprotein D and lipocalin family protein
MRLKKNLFVFVLLLSWNELGCAQKLAPPVTATANLDLVRYMGVWNEIARLPFPFEDDCFGVSAKYKLLTDDEIMITNYCWEKSLFGPMKRAQGSAWLGDPSDKGKLKVSFFLPFVLDYWVLYVDKDYQFAVVGTPDRKYLWILARNSVIDEARYQALVEIARSMKYDTTLLIRTPQRDTGVDTQADIASATAVVIDSDSPPKTDSDSNSKSEVSHE